MTERRILVALDASEDAQRVATFVNEFFGGLGVEILALHVSAAPVEPALAAPVFAWPYFDASRAPLGVAAPGPNDDVEEHGLATIQQTGLDDDDAIVAVGAVAASIRRVAAERDVDIIVVGSSDRTLLDRLLSPSVAKELLKSAPCPVLVVP